MNEERIGKFERMFLKNWASLSMIFFLLASTLLFYLIFQSYFGKNPDFYSIGIIAGLTGGLWGYGMTRMAQFRDMISKGELCNTSKSCLCLFIYSTILMIGSLLFFGCFNSILLFFNLN